MGTTGEPLSEERLAEIRERLTYRNDPTSPRFRSNSVWAEHVAEDEAALLAELDRLRTERTALVALAQQMAQLGESIPIDRDDEGQWVTSDDIRPLAEQARALLASDAARPDAPGRE